PTTDLPTSDTPDNPQEEAFVRPNFGTLNPNGPEVAAFRQGVQVMKSRPASDPTSWLYQANIHGTYDTPALEAWNTCQHGSFYFLSWHRMYLYYFERILRKASGDPKFALPFWDYTNPAQRAIPEPLRNPANPQNPLFVAERNAGINQGAQVPASGTTFTTAMTFTNFASPGGSGLSFGGQTVPQPTHFSGVFGQLESQPHNIIHVLVGGQNGWMSDPNLAARDPIFWLHHANIDRLWNVWKARGGGRVDPTAQNWLDQVFVFFDENGQRVELTGKQVVESAAQLKYTYADGSGDEPGPEADDSLPAAPFTDNKREVVVNRQIPTRLTRERARVTVPGVPVAAPQGVGQPEERLTLSIEGIKFGRPGIYYEVYANLPQNAQPDPSSPNYIGNLAIFGQLEDGQSAHAGHGGADKSLKNEAILTYEITAVVERLRAQGFQGNLDLHFVPKGLESDQPGLETAAREVRFERVRVIRE
ncbi:MAG TPA: tyrosinase family protein, partial [Thermoanaerobaculia bacterium]|nr:tyrosinase family protein [Thermoanaerobaculia bacterium]